MLATLYFARQGDLDDIYGIATVLPRTMLRYAIEHLDPEQRTHYRSR